MLRTHVCTHSNTVPCTHRSRGRVLFDVKGDLYWGRGRTLSGPGAEGAGGEGQGGGSGVDGRWAGSEGGVWSVGREVRVSEVPLGSIDVGWSSSGHEVGSRGRKRSEVGLPVRTCLGVATVGTGGGCGKVGSLESLKPVFGSPWEFRSTGGGGTRVRSPHRPCQGCRREEGERTSPDLCHTLLYPYNPWTETRWGFNTWWVGQGEEFRGERDSESRRRSPRPFEPTTLEDGGYPHGGLGTEWTR